VNGSADFSRNCCRNAAAGRGKYRKKQTKTMNKKETRQKELTAHYARCERIAKHLGAKAANGKKISLALLKIERDAGDAALAQCNGETCGGQPFRGESEMSAFTGNVIKRVSAAFGVACVPGLFVNLDPRGYALKIDNEIPAGAELIRETGMIADFGGYGILSPEIAS
jgi:hypothetical protein